MNYLDPAEYVAFGLSEETPDSLVGAASAMIDGFCQRLSIGVANYVERLRVRRDGRTVRLSNSPPSNIPGSTLTVTACRVRLARVRECAAQTPLQEAASVFGVGGTWTSIDPSTLLLFPDGYVEIPANFLGVPFDEAEITYDAGFTTMPAPVKTACAQIVRNASATPALNVKSQRVDTMTMEYFGPELLDDNVKRILRPYVAMRLG